MTKADLKDGQVVIIRNGDICLVAGNLLLGHNVWLNLDNFSECLDNEPFGLKNPKFDIMEIYEVCFGEAIDIVYNKSVEKDVCKIWERLEKPVEMTISELEHKLGIKNLKIVKENEETKYKKN